MVVHTWNFSFMKLRKKASSVIQILVVTSKSSWNHKQHSCKCKLQQIQYDNIPASLYLYLSQLWFYQGFLLRFGYVWHIPLTIRTLKSLNHWYQRKLRGVQSRFSPDMEAKNPLAIKTKQVTTEMNENQNTACHEVSSLWIKICRILMSWPQWTSPLIKAQPALSCSQHLPKPSNLTFDAWKIPYNTMPHTQSFTTEQVPFPDVPPVSMKILCSGSIPRTSWQASATTVKGKSHKWITCRQSASPNSAMYTVYTLYVQKKNTSSTNLKSMHQLSTMLTTVATH